MGDDHKNDKDHELDPEHSKMLDGLPETAYVHSHDGLEPHVHGAYGLISGYGVSLKIENLKMTDSPILSKLLVQLMETVSAKCEEKGATVIGHIKSYLKSEEGFLRCDTIGDSESIGIEGKVKTQAEYTLVINTIIHGIKEEAAKASTLDAINQVFCEPEFRVIPIAEHAALH